MVSAAARASLQPTGTAGPVRFAARALLAPAQSTGTARLASLLPLCALAAAFLFVAGHYPVYSACAHGNTQWAIDEILPRLRAAHATGYLSGHDHCGEFIDARATDGLVFVVSGTGDGCCYAASNVDGVPPGSLAYALAGDRNPTNATGGFAAFRFAAEAGTGAITLNIAFHDQDGAPLYAAPPLQARV